MKQHHNVVREISYASSAQSRGGRALIRTVENLTGRQRLLRRARGYETQVANGEDFWQVMVERYGVQLSVQNGDLAKIPTDGPLIVIANHPYGILDGLVLGNILSQTRGDFRILANSVFHKARDLNRVVLPISFDQTREAIKANIAVRKKATNYLIEGGCIGVFPGGTVSTSAKLMGHPMDPQWRNFTAKLVAKSNPTVVPIYFSGANSRLFQLASHAHNTLRMAMLIREFKKRIKHDVSLVVGDPIRTQDLQQYKNDPTALMAFLRQETYKLSPEPLDNYNHGYEFEEQYK